MFKHAIVYSNVWEDPELNRRSLMIKPEDSVLSITSGGCNSLNLLVEGPQKVVSIDGNPTQNYLLEYKIAAVKSFDYDEFIEALGVEFYNRPSKFSPDYRLELYDKLRHLLSSEAKNFWDENRDIIRSGIVMCGKVEKFFKLYRKILMFLYGSKYSTIEKIFFCPDIAIQRKMYDSINFGRWHFINWLFLNRTILSAVKGAHSFRHVDEKEFDKNLNRKVDRAMRNLDNRTNYFFSLILLGKFLSPKCLPPYLLKENFDKLKNNIDRIEVFQGISTDVLKKFGPESFNKFNMSNIFEWMEDDIFNNVMREFISLAKPNSRLCYRYTLAKPRNLDEANSKILISEPDLAAELYAIDRSFMYESFHVYRIENK